jgi:hypothetical protein
VPVAEVDLDRILRRNKQARRFSDNLSQSQEQFIRSRNRTAYGEGKKKHVSRPLLGCGNAGSRRPRRSRAPVSGTPSCNARSFAQKFHLISARAEKKERIRSGFAVADLLTRAAAAAALPPNPSPLVRGLGGEATASVGKRERMEGVGVQERVAAGRRE